jgi:3-hydroxyacyl-CoA dehydrogenase/enoyl-CoA hydratase/carnithine racemase
VGFERFEGLAARTPGEVVTRSRLSYVELARGAGTLALITLDNGGDSRRPNTLGPRTLLELGRTLETLRQRAGHGEISAVGITGRPGFLAAGADLSTIKSVRTVEDGRLMAELGHEVYGLLAGLGVPSFAFINGVALGGGLEMALAAGYRTVSTGATAVGLPEAFIGLVPGWGGVYRLPRLTGPRAAVKVMIENPLSNNRLLDGAIAHELGIADALLPADGFLRHSLAWAAGVLSGQLAGDVAERRARLADYDDVDWRAAVASGKAFVAGQTGVAAPAPLRLLELLERGRTWSAAESASAECTALAELIETPQFHASVYAFLELVQKRARKPVGAPEAAKARRVGKVGVVGAGLMARQLALLIARRLRVPVVISDLDQSRVDAGLSGVHDQVAKLVASARIMPEAGEPLKKLITGSVSLDAFADADFVIEAVSEELAAKKRVFAGLEAVVSRECVLATNTSSLSVAAMGTDLVRPERLVGLHFFNPVPAMPLVEIIRTPETGAAALATAFALAANLKKSPVLVRDAPAFVVNRVLGRMLGEIMKSFDEGTDASTVDHALDPLGLPMTPFRLLPMVGLAVAQHVQESLHASFGDRFYVSPNQQRLIDAGIGQLWCTSDDGGEYVPESVLGLLERGSSPSTPETIRRRTLEALADEIRRLLDDCVVAAPEDVDLCMILGAGWPLHLGGITPYLDSTGTSERVTGATFR